MTADTEPPPDETSKENETMSDWRDDPALAHLRADAPYVVCSGCGRKSWGDTATGGACGMPQPSGGRCAGVFGFPAGTPAIERPEDVPRLTVFQCPECGELHHERTGECAHECGAEMIEVEVVEVRGITDRKASDDA